MLHGLLKRGLQGLFALSLLASLSVFASGFQLWEESGAGTGDYHAGGAAVANDASTEFYNPAGEIRLKHIQVSTGGVLIPFDVAFKGTVNGVPTPGFVYGNTNNVIPNFHIVIPIDSRFAFGFGATTPFGLRTAYAANAFNIVSRSATTTYLLTINLNPSFAVAINHMISVGFGVDMMYGYANYSALPILGAATFINKLSGVGWGYNAGILFQFSHGTRVGVSYRSQVNINANGSSALTITSTITKRVSAKLPLPATTIFSIYQQLNKRLSAMLSAYYTNWNAFTTLVLRNTALGNITVHDNYRNTWNFAFGLHLLVIKGVMLKMGIGYDQTPTRNRFRDERLPGANRFALALGIHVQPSKNYGFDIGWTHLFVGNSVVNNSGTSGQLVPAVIGIAKLSANVFAVQFTANLN